MHARLLPRRLDSLWSAVTGWPRRLAALCCLLLAGLSAVSSHAPPPAQPLTDLVVAARDVGAGSVLGAADLRPARWPRSQVPAGAARSVNALLGRPVGAAVSRGEPLTAARMLDTTISTGLRPGQVAMPARLADGVSATVFPAGSFVDLYAPASTDVPSPGSPATPGGPVAERVRVLATLVASEAGAASSVSLMVAVDRRSAQRMSAVSGQSFVATLLPPSG